MFFESVTVIHDAYKTSDKVYPTMDRAGKWPRKLCSVLKSDRPAE